MEMKSEKAPHNRKGGEEWEPPQLSAGCDQEAPLYSFPFTSELLVVNSGLLP